MPNKSNACILKRILTYCFRGTCDIVRHLYDRWRSSSSSSRSVFTAETPIDKTAM